MAQQQAQAYVFMALGYQLDADGKTDWKLPRAWTPEVWSCRVSDNSERLFVGVQSVTVEVPDDFNPIARQIAALEGEKRAAMDLYQKSVKDINERLSKLMAITNEVEA